MPVQFAVLRETLARVPLMADPFWIGRDPACELCVWDLRVSRRHAKVHVIRGEWLLSSESRHETFVNGRPMQVMSLRHGDMVALTPPDRDAPVRMRFENEMEGTFVPPGTPLSTAWLERQALRPPRPGVVGRYALQPGGVGSLLRGRDLDTGVEVALKLMDPPADGRAGDDFLSLCAALAGATHPGLAAVVEGGIDPTPEGIRRWIATEIVPGRSADARVAEGAQSAITVLRRLRVLCGAIHLLHVRGVVHGDVTPGHVVLRPDGGAVLVGFEHAYLRSRGPVSAPSGEDGPGYVAPEVTRGGLAASGPAADVYGLAAVGYAMLTGRAPGGHPDASDERLGDTAGLPRPSRLGVKVPAAVEDVLLAALSLDPARRPSAEALTHLLAHPQGEDDVPRPVGGETRAWPVP